MATHKWKTDKIDVLTKGKHSIITGFYCLYEEVVVIYFDQNVNGLVS
jgi:hypothetical protein